ncbi:MAG: deoxyguanosinetriphosphate triphosphohydrolase [Micrococcales bacterium]|nr:deoxyguanosinetriphosphate triphosphohydrolase [Micrococcales bacterium]
MNPSISQYSNADLARWVNEESKQGTRSEFARDRARVLHCSALRRLAGKTQVVVVGESDVPRTRLTHSLEVAQVARELGASLGCAPDVVDVAGLAHDLGHPPFGHNGEAVLNEIGRDCGGFEGNAQTFRILTRLEAKVMSPDGDSVGLNLTRASLDAATKYPWQRHSSTPKFGVYEDDLPAFDWMRAEAPGQRKCLEAQVMDWADDVAYSVHDIDDAIQLGHLEPEILSDRDQRNRIIERCIAWYAPEADYSDVEAAFDRLRRLDAWVDTFDGSMRDLAAVKRMTSSLIGRFCRSAEDATRSQYGGEPLRRFQADLIVPLETRLEVAVMKAMAAVYVMSRPGAEAQFMRQREILSGVVAVVEIRGSEVLEPWLRPAWDLAVSDAHRMRIALDQVASLTDSSVEKWHRKLTS